MNLLPFLMMLFNPYYFTCVFLMQQILEARMKARVGSIIITLLLFSLIFFFLKSLYEGEKDTKGKLCRCPPTVPQLESPPKLK